MAPDGKGYLIPAEPSPDDMLCVKVFIPNDLLYIAAFWHSVEFLTTWTAWQRDAAHRATEAAAAWKAAWVLSRAAFEEGDDCEGSGVNLDVRTKPGEPCILEKSTDGGETWIEFADLSACPPNVMLGSDGKTIIYWCPTCGPDGGPGWTPLPNPDDDYDPAHDDPQTPFPDWPDPESTAACVFAANLVEALKSVLDRVDVGLQTGTLAILVYTGFEVAQFVTRVLIKRSDSILAYLASLATLDYEVYHADYEVFDWDEAINLLACFYDDDGTVTEASYAFGMGRLDAMTGPVWSVIKAILALVGPNGCNNAATYAGITSYACEPDCSECQDFEVSPYLYSVLGAYGEWEGGIGWKGELNGDIYQVEVLGPAIPGEWDHVRVSWYFTGSFKLMSVRFDGVEVYHDEYGPAGGRIADIAWPGSVTEIAIVALQDNLNNDVRITSVCYYP